VLADTSDMHAVFASFRDIGRPSLGESEDRTALLAMLIPNVLILIRRIVSFKGLEILIISRD